MIIEFNYEHLKTLAELQALAEKHDCIIGFGVKTEYINVNDAMYFLKCPKDIEKELFNKCDINLEIGNMSSIWFKLIDKKHSIYNSLTYNDVQALVNFKRNSFEILSEETKEWLDGNMNKSYSYDVYDCYFSINSQKEEIYGFEGIAKEGCCYRTGIILAVFAQLVCDYLHEPRIIKTY